MCCVVCVSCGVFCVCCVCCRDMAMLSVVKSHWGLNLPAVGEKRD